MYSCPGCGSGLKFSIEEQKLLCEYCHEKYEIDSVKDGSETTERFATNVFTCSQCGGEIYSLDNDLTGRCSYCGLDQTFHSRIQKMNRPKYIIPFQKNKEFCKEEYLKVSKRAIYTPKELKDKDYIDGFRGIYMPYWLYDIKYNQALHLQGTKHYSRGNYDITDYYALTGTLQADYPFIPHDASSSFSDHISERIEPYHLDSSTVKEFSPAYLSGFYGEMKDLDEDTYLEYASDIANEFSTNFVKNSWTDYNPEVSASSINAYEKKAELGLMPVWFLSYQKNGRVSYAAVNAQTGKLSAELPISIGRFLFGILLGFIPIYILLNLFFAPKPDTIVMLSSVTAVISLLLFYFDFKQMLKQAYEASDSTIKKSLDIYEKKLLGIGSIGNRAVKYGLIVKTVGIVLVLVLFLFEYLFLKSEAGLDRQIQLLTEHFAITAYTLVAAGIGFFIFFVINNCLRIKKKLQFSMFPGYIFALIALLMATVLQFWKPVSDVYYYFTSFVCLTMVLLNLFCVIRCHNALASRPLPQFKHSGGDDSAKTK